MTHDLAAWAMLDAEWRRCQDAGFHPRLWWRDDDAVTITSALELLVEITDAAEIPVLLGVIPVPHQPDLLLGFMPKHRISLAVHGYDHQNHAAEGEKKCEFPSARRGGDGPATLFVARQFGAVWQNMGWRGGDVFVPPWNRIDPVWYADLAAAGFGGLSGFGSRSAAFPVPGLFCVNTHIDVIDWSHRAFAGQDILLQALAADWAARREGRADPAEPTGILTHHLVHDAGVWDFLNALIDWAGARDMSWIDPFAVLPAST